MGLFLFSSHFRISDPQVAFSRGGWGGTAGGVGQVKKRAMVSFIPWFHKPLEKRANLFQNLKPIWPGIGRTGEGMSSLLAAPKLTLATKSSWRHRHLGSSSTRLSCTTLARLFCQHCGYSASSCTLSTNSSSERVETSWLEIIRLKCFHASQWSGQNVY